MDDFWDFYIQKYHNFPGSFFLICNLLDLEVFWLFLVFNEIMTSAKFLGRWSPQGTRLISLDTSHCPNLITNLHRTKDQFRQGSDYSFGLIQKWLIGKPIILGLLHKYLSVTSHKFGFVILQCKTKVLTRCHPIPTGDPTQSDAGPIGNPERLAGNDSSCESISWPF